MVLHTSSAQDEIEVRVVWEMPPPTSNTTSKEAG